MRRILALSLLLILLLAGCTPADAVYVHDTPPINVAVTSGNISTNVTSNVTISGNVIVTNTPLPVQSNNGTHLAIQQDVVADPNNSSTANLLSSANFTGVATSTLGVSAIQVSLKTDQNMIVYVEQSPDGANWDIVDHFDYIYSLGGNSWTVQAVNSYARVVVVNTNGTATTYFRLQTALCPIVEAVPRAPSDNGRLRTQSMITDLYGNNAEITPENELRMSQSVKLAGGIFTGTVVDPNFWTTNTTANGSVFQDVRTATSGGELTLSTNTTANGASRISSVRRARYVAGNANYARMVVHFPDAGTANNVRRFGVADYSTITTITDGAYFQLSGTTFSVAVMRGGTANTTSDGAFNGNYGTHYHIDTNTSHVFEIYYTTFKVQFTIDGILLHEYVMAASPWANTVTLYLYADNVNSGGSTTNVIYHIRSFSIHRLGPTLSAPKYVHISTAATTICKYSSGTLQAVIINNPTNNAITIYDNTVGSGTVIAVINPGASAVPVALHYGIDFSTGLTIVTAGSPDITVVYE